MKDRKRLRAPFDVSLGPIYQLSEEKKIKEKVERVFLSPDHRGPWFGAATLKKVGGRVSMGLKRLVELGEGEGGSMKIIKET